MYVCMYVFISLLQMETNYKKELRFFPIRWQVINTGEKTISIRSSEYGSPDRINILRQVNSGP